MTRKVRNPMFPGPKAFYKRSVMEFHKPSEDIKRAEPDGEGVAYYAADGSPRYAGDAWSPFYEWKAPEGE